MNKKEFIKRMEQKLTYGDCINNEDLMRGLLILLTEDDSKGKTEDKKTSEEFDVQAIARAFYNANKLEILSDVEENAKKLRKELNFIQYTTVISEISQIDKSYNGRKIVDAMNNV